ncbi:MAG: CinA family protein [Anaerolineales bacterium]
MTKPLEEVLGEKLREHGLRLAVAESCTGGLVGHRLTNIAGSSTYYVGSVTAYAYEAKVRLLGVTWETLEKYGAVSAETVTEMARGVRRSLAADVGIAVSGIAGPGGGMPGKPVGLVWMAVSAKDDTMTRKWNFKGDRIAVKEQAAEMALQIGIDYLDKKVK